MDDLSGFNTMEKLFVSEIGLSPKSILSFGLEVI